MKKLFITACMAVALTTTVNAQEAIKPAEAPKPQLSKEERAKQKQKAEDDLNAAFKEAGVTDDEVKQAKAIMEEAKAKRSEIKKSTTFTEEEKITKSKESNNEEKEKLIKLLGADKYKAFKEAQKKQKAAATPTTTM